MFFKVRPEIHEKLWVERTKLQICHSQTKSVHKKINGFLRKQKYYIKNRIENRGIKEKTETDTET